MKPIGRAHLVLAFFLLVASALAVMHWRLPAFWGNPGIAAKYAFVASHSTRYQRLFIGSSHIYRQLSPELFDSIVNDGHKSFNMGYASTAAPEAELICEAVLRNPRIHAKEVYVELSPFLVFTDSTLKSCRFWYMAGPRTWWSLSSYAWTKPQVPLGKRLEHVENATAAFANAVFLPGLLSQWQGRDMKSGALVFGPAGDGFMPLELEDERYPGAGMQGRKAALAADTLVLLRRSTWIRSAYASGTEASDGGPYLAMLQHLIELGNRRGVKVNFILPPLITSTELLAVYRALPAGHKFDLCDPTRFPAFYRTENTFDKGHLNTNGSKLFTELLARQVKQRQQAMHRE